jgi:hypothetical protein
MPWARLHRKPERALKAAYGLCQQMMHFFHQFRLYITFEALEPASIIMQSRIRAASTVDQVPSMTLQAFVGGPGY